MRLEIVINFFNGAIISIQVFRMSYEAASARNCEGCSGVRHQMLYPGGNVPLLHITLCDCLTINRRKKKRAVCEKSLRCRTSGCDATPSVKVDKPFEFMIGLVASLNQFRRGETRALRNRISRDERDISQRLARLMFAHLFVAAKLRNYVCA